MQGWNRDLGCVAWDNLMEDLATLEISRAQTWQWLYHNISLDTGETVDESLITTTFDEEFNKITAELNLDENSSAFKEFKKAKEDACTLFLNKEMPAFLTTESEIG